MPNFHFSHYKSMPTATYVAIETKSSYPIGTKNTIIRFPGL